MKRHSILSFFIALVFLVFFLCDISFALEVMVSPNEVFPGDAFVIKLTNTRVSKMSPASFMGKKFYFSRSEEPCFIAIGAVEMKTQPGVYPVNLKIGKRRKRMDIVVKHISFPTREITLPEDEVFLSTENLKRVKKEERRLKSIFQKVPDRLWDGCFTLPLEHEILAPYGTKRILNMKRMSLHRGVDIRGKEGEEVKASNSGRVVLAEELFFGGNTVVLDHGQGIFTLYMHLSEFMVKTGDIASKGNVVGFVGSTGRSSGPHLHFGAKVMGTNTNPISVVELDL